MEHSLRALVLAAILIVGGGIVVAGVTSSSVDEVSQPRQDIEALSGERLGTDLTDVSTQVTNGELTRITDPGTLMPAAATTTLVRAGSGEVAPGASITVPVTAENVPAGSPLGATTIEVRYDPSVIDATACNVDPNAIFGYAICNPDFDNDAIDPDAVRFNATSASGVSGDLLLANITFAAVGQSGDTSVVDVVIAVFADPAGNAVPASGQDGQICLTPCADFDGDGVPDANDNCPAWSNSDQSLPTWPVAADDPDCDGWSTDDENFIGTNPLLACGVAAWPPDINNDHDVDVFDVNILKPAFFSMPPGPPYDVRLDLKPDNGIDIFDVNRLKVFFFLSCTS